MEENYTKDVLRAATAHVCQMIGFTNAQGSALEILQDVLQRFLTEFAITLRRKVEHNNRVLAVPRDVAYVLERLDINPDKLQHFVQNVEGEGLPVEVQKFPIPKKNELRFLPTESAENVERPDYMYAYLPSTSLGGAGTSDYTLTVENDSRHGDARGEQGLCNGAVAQRKDVDDAAGRTLEKNSSGAVSGEPNAHDDESGKKALSCIPDDLYDLWGRDDPPTPPPPTPPPPVDVPLAQEPTPEVKPTPAVLQENSTHFIATDKKSARDMNPSATKPLWKNKHKTNQSLDAFEKRKLKKQKKLLKMSKTLGSAGDELLSKPHLPTTSNRTAEDRKLMRKQARKEKLSKKNATAANNLNRPFALAPDTKLFDLNATPFKPNLSSALPQHSGYLSNLNNERKYSPPRFGVEQAHPELKSFNTDINIFKQEHVNEPVRFAEPPKAFQNMLPISFPSTDPKLSTSELDQNKLNIFKKIPKQKAKTPAPLIMTQTETAGNLMNTYCENPSPFINLPSGTTITPTTVQKPKALPLDPSSSFLGNTSMGLSVAGTSIQAVPPAQQLPPVDASLEYKPKKRGRKPGSKNQPKIKVPKLENVDSKSFKSAPINMANLQYPLNFQTQAAGLRDFNTGGNMFNQFHGGPTNSGKLDIFPNSFMLNPANQLANTMNLLPQLTNSQIQSFLPTFMAANKPHNAFMPTSNMPTMDQSASAFPMFVPLAAKPSLIPTGSGLFPPTNLADFQNLRANNSGAAMNVLSSFMPQNSFNNFSADKLQSTSERNDPGSNLSSHLSLESKKGFCNVPPLLPENMKLPNVDSPLTKDSFALFKNRTENLHHQMGGPIFDNKPNVVPFQNPNPTAISGIALVAALNAVKDGNRGAAQLQHTATGNIDDPIEVSDDSTDGKPAPAPAPAPALNLTTQAFHLNNSELKSRTQGNLISPGSGLKVPQKESNEFHCEKFNLNGGVELIPLPSKMELNAQFATQFPSTSKQFTSTSTTFAGEDHTKFGNFLYDPVTITPAARQQPSVESIGKSKEHKKMKKSKDIKTKKKKDKKDKSKNRERSAESSNKSLKSDRDMLKKLKKEKKKEKQRLQLETAASEAPAKMKDELHFLAPLDAGVSNPMMNSPKLALPSAVVVTQSNSPSSSFPKITLKLNNITSKPTSVNDEPAGSTSCLTPSSENFHSNELARFSPLVTRPKQKRASAEPHVPKHKTVMETPIVMSSASNNTTELVPPASNWQSGATLSASSVLLPQQLTQKLVQPEPLLTPTLPLPSTPRHKPAKRAAYYESPDGKKTWICPGCGKPDDGSPMVGCDGPCQAWYHWVCVGIYSQDDLREEWYCPNCPEPKKNKKKQK